MKTISGKKALITGAAAGIGRAIALALAREGAELYLLDVDEEGLATLVAETKAIGVNAIADYCDLSRPAEIDRALRQMLRVWPEVDILVNNAGVAYYGPTHQMSNDQWDWLLKINLLAPIHITRELLPMFTGRPGSHILNVCSVSGLVAAGRSAAYHTSKFGLIGFTEALRAEYGRRGVGVSALCPGPVLTNLYKSCAASKEHKSVPLPPAWLCCTVEDVADAAITCIRRNKRLKLVGLFAHVIAWSKWLAPGLLDLLNHFSRKRITKFQVVSDETKRAA